MAVVWASLHRNVRAATFSLNFFRRIFQFWKILSHRWRMSNGWLEVPTDCFIEIGAKPSSADLYELQKHDMIKNEKNQKSC